MVARIVVAALAAASLAIIPSGGQGGGAAAANGSVSDSLAVFAPRPDGRQHRLDYTAWSEALAAFVLSMGPPLRKMPVIVQGPMGTRIKIGHNSIYRLEGAMVGFSLIDREVMVNIARYRRELEDVADQVDIPSLPRNEQLAYWLNLHNVAMVEKIGENWPIHQPRELLIDGVPLDEARFISVAGEALSLRDIRERVVFANWKNPAVIYGFWRGEIGGPAIQRAAFDGRSLSDQLDRAAHEFVNSRRGVERRGGTLHVSQLYAEAAPFYFTDFDADLRSHLARYVEGKVAEMLAETSRIDTTLREHDIADTSGGRRNNAFFANGRLDPGTTKLLDERRRKLDYIRRTQPRSGTVTFSNITLPGDPPNKGEVD